MLKKLQWTALVGVAVLVAVEGLAVAQMGGMGGMGSGTNMQRPKRKLKKSRAPALSPALNLVDGAQTDFGAQFLLRQQFPNPLLGVLIGMYRDYP